MSNNALIRLQDMDPAGVLRVESVAKLLDVAPRTVWFWVKQDDRFPKPFKIAKRATAWRRADILAWLQVKSDEQTNIEAL